MTKYRDWARPYLDPRSDLEPSSAKSSRDSHVGQNVRKWQDMGRDPGRRPVLRYPALQVNTVCSTDATGAPTEFETGNIISDAVFDNDSRVPGRPPGQLVGQLSLGQTFVGFSGLLAGLAGLFPPRS